MGEVIPKIPCPSAARTVKLSGPLTVATAARAAKALRRLAGASTEPIALYIHSGGGEVAAFYQLSGVMDNLRVRGKRCKVFTVASHANSAATYLLLAGHRAFVTPDAKIGLHGTRGTLPKNSQPLVRETALALAMRLDRENRSVARILAKHMVFRLAARHRELLPKNTRLTDQFPLSALEKFNRQLAKRLSSPRSRRVLNESFERLKFIFALSPAFPTQTQPATAHIMAAREAELFHAAIAYELAAVHHKKWRLDATASAELLMDFLLAKDFLPGDHLKLARRIARQFGRNFLPGSKIKIYERLRQKSPNKAEIFLINAALPYALGLWYFAVTLCHRLLAGGHTFSANDAYWLGLVDEVLPDEAMS